MKQFKNSPEQAMQSHVSSVAATYTIQGHADVTQAADFGSLYQLFEDVFPGQRLYFQSGQGLI